MATETKSESKVNKRRTEAKTFNNGKYCVFTAWLDKHPSDWAPRYDEETMNYLVFQVERCPSTLREHFQGYVEFKKSTRLEKARTLLGINVGGWHAEQRLETSTAYHAMEYCKKLDTRIRPPQEFGTPPKKEKKSRGHRSDLEGVYNSIKEGKTLKQVASAHPSEFIKFHAGIEKMYRLVKETKMPMPDIVLRPWQYRLIEIVERGPVDRQIVWVWSEASSTGKTTTMKYLVAKYGTDSVLPGTFKLADLMYAYDDHKIIVFNIPREHEINATDICVLETISDRNLIMSPKFLSTGKIVNSVIIVFSNARPPESRLRDRIISIPLDPEPSLGSV